jgi:formate dehydrogenase subunit gamma
MTVSSPVDQVRLRIIAEGLRGTPGALLPVLQAIQAEFGHVPAEATSIIAEVLNLSRADVFGVLTFYSDLRQKPPNGPVVTLCRAEACQSMGGESLASQVSEHLGGVAEVETVYCLGLCAVAPAAMVGRRLVGRATIARIEAALP